MKFSPTCVAPRFGQRDTFFNNRLSRARTELIKAIDAQGIQRDDIYNIFSQECRNPQDNRLLILVRKHNLNRVQPQFEALFNKLGYQKVSALHPYLGEKIDCWKNPEGIRHFVIEPQSRYR